LWDIFISHASEDKDTVVRPLAKMLKEYGIRVWYDEFELKLGDSLSKSIDKGLSNSSYGIIILSNSFLEKGWTDYELRSLISQEILKRDKVILPIWHEIGIQEIARYSPFLTDKFALSTSVGIDELALKVVAAIRPEIINNSALKAIVRERVPHSKKEKVDIKKIKVQEKFRHKSLPNYMIVSVKLICEVLADVFDMDYITVLENFARDLDYDKEYVVWNAIANSYLEFIRLYKIDYSDVELKREIAAFLFLYSLGAITDIEEYQMNHTKFDCAKYYELISMYCENMVTLLQFFEDELVESFRKK